MVGVDLQQHTTKAVAQQRNAFDAYLKQGGFPELLQVKNEKKYVTSLVSNILQRDIEVV